MAAFAEVNFTSFGLGATSTLMGRLRLGLDFTTATGGATGVGLAATATGFMAFLATGATVCFAVGLATGFTTFLAIATGFTTFFGLGFTAFAVGFAFATTLAFAIGFLATGLAVLTAFFATGFGVGFATFFASAFGTGLANFLTGALATGLVIFFAGIFAFAAGLAFLFFAFVAIVLM